MKLVSVKVNPGLPFASRIQMARSHLASGELELKNRVLAQPASGPLVPRRIPPNRLPVCDLTGHHFPRSRVNCPTSFNYGSFILAAIPIRPRTARSVVAFEMYKLFLLQNLSSQS